MVMSFVALQGHQSSWCLSHLSPVGLNVGFCWGPFREFLPAPISSDIFLLFSILESDYPIFSQGLDPFRVDFSVGWEVRIKFHLFTRNYTFWPAPICWRCVFSPLCIFASLSKIRWPYVCGKISESSIVFHWSVCLSIYFLKYYRSEHNLKPRMVAFCMLCVCLCVCVCAHVYVSEWN